MLVSMRVMAPGTEARTGGSVRSTAAAVRGPQGLWAAMAAAAVADEAYDPSNEPPHVDFLRRMAEIDEAYDRGLVTPPDAEVIDLAAARARLRS